MRNAAVSLIRAMVRLRRVQLEQLLAEALYRELGDWEAAAFLEEAQAHLDALSIVLKKRRLPCPTQNQ